MNDKRLAQLSADRKHGIERSHRFLKNHRNEISAYTVHLRKGNFCQIEGTLSISKEYLPSLNTTVFIKQT